MCGMIDDPLLMGIQALGWLPLMAGEGRRSLERDMVRSRYKSRECLADTLPLVRRSQTGRSEITAMLHEVQNCSRDTSVDSPVVSSASKWGWACTITPIFDAKMVTALPELREGALWELYQAGDARHDMALVRRVTVN